MDRMLKKIGKPCFTKHITKSTSTVPISLQSERCYVTVVNCLISQPKSTSWENPGMQPSVECKYHHLHCMQARKKIRIASNIRPCGNRKIIIRNPSFQSLGQIFLPRIKGSHSKPGRSGLTNAVRL